MEKRERAQSYLRQRKMLLMMPLLIIPFLTMGFWALGGGKGSHDGKSKSTAGLNPLLPDARLREEPPGGKLSFYDQAQKDSVKKAEWMRNDPYYRARQQSDLPAGAEGMAQRAATGPFLPASPYTGSEAGPEEMIMEKLATLQRELKDPAAPSVQKEKRADLAGRRGELSHDVNRLEHLMEGMKRASAEDPEMQKLESVMDKILDIQHPERVRRRLEQGPVTADTQEPALPTAPRPTVSLLQAPGARPESVDGFFSGEEALPGPGDPTTIAAVVHGTQRIGDGTVVKLRLVQGLQAGEALIPAGTFVYGRASLSGERLRIPIHSLHYNGALYPISLEAYDLDGIAGIAAPGALGRDVAKESADRSLAHLDLSTLDPSLKTRAAAAGLGAAKNFLSRKAKKVTITLKEGYRILLKSAKG